MAKPPDNPGIAPPKRYESKKLTDDEKREIHEEAMRLAEEAWTAERDNIREGKDCQKFYAADQWDVKAKKVREEDGRPVLTINLLPQTVRQMTGDLRKSPPSLKYLPSKGNASKETAEALNGITRHIEQQSNAKDCYIIATENAAIASQGFFRVVTQYSSDDGFDQDIRIKPIRDPFGALLDPYALLPDRSDIRYGFVFEYLSKDDFKAAYPDSVPEEIPISEPNNIPWRAGETICIAEYWRRKSVKKTLILLDDGSTVEDEGKIPPGRTETRRRDVESYEVNSYMVSGKEVLSGPHPFPCRYIPICMVVGEEISTGSSTIRKGMVHDARDPQRILNYATSASVEATALQPKAPYLISVNQIKGWEPTWQTAGSKNHPYLPYNVDPLAPNTKPERSPPPIASQGLDAMALMAGQNLQSVTGIFDAKLGNKSNETSGVAIAARQQQGDTTTYLYPDNLGRALGYLGRILADLIPRVMDTEQQVRILKEDGGAEMITINANPTSPPMDAKGKPQPVYDLSQGEYDVTVVTGPNFASRRAEAAAHMIELARGVPMVGQVAPDLIVENMDFPGADKIAKRIQKAMGIGDDGEPEGDQKADPVAQAEAAAKAAGALKDGALTDKIIAETQGINLTNAQMYLQMQQFMAQLPAIMSALQQATQGGQGGQPPQPGAPPENMAPPAAPPQMPMGAQPEPMMDDGGLVELETLDAMPGAGMNPTTQDQFP